MRLRGKDKFLKRGEEIRGLGRLILCAQPPTNKNGRIPIAHVRGCLQWVVYIRRTKEGLFDWLGGGVASVVLIQGNK